MMKKGEIRALLNIWADQNVQWQLDKVGVNNQHNCNTSDRCPF